MEEGIFGLISEISKQYGVSDFVVCYAYESVFYRYFKGAYSISFNLDKNDFIVIKHYSDHDDLVSMSDLRRNEKIFFDKLRAGVENDMVRFLNGGRGIEKYMFQNVRGVVSDVRADGAEILIRGGIAGFMPSEEACRIGGIGSNIEGVVIKGKGGKTVVSQKNHLFIKNIIKKELDMDVDVVHRIPGRESRVKCSAMPSKTFARTIEFLCGEKIIFSIRRNIGKNME